MSYPGLETVQVIHYAGRALQLAEQCCAQNLESQFLEQMAKAKSNLPEHGDGAQIYQKWVKPAFVDIERVAGHYAISSLFENYGDKTQVYCYDVERDNYSLEAEGKMRLATGSVRLSSEITEESAQFDFGVLQLGEHNITAGVGPHDRSANGELRGKLIEAFSQADSPEAIRILDQMFGSKTYSLRLLFRDEQRKITNQILNESLTSAAAVYRTIFESQAPLIRFLHGLSIPVPRALMSAAEIALNSQLEQFFERPDLDADSIRGLLREAAASSITLDVTTLEYAIRRRIEKEADEFAANPNDPGIVERITASLDLIPSIPFPVVLWEAQNVCYGPLVEALEKLPESTSPADKQIEMLAHLAELLKIRVPQSALQAA